MSHSHIRFHFPSGITEERCLEHAGWRVDEYTHSVAVGPAATGTYYPLASMQWFGFRIRSGSCDEEELRNVEDDRLSMFIQETLGDFWDKISGRGGTSAPAAPAIPLRQGDT